MNDQAQAVEDGRDRRHTRWRAAQVRTRRGGDAQSWTDHPGQSQWSTPDKLCLYLGAWRRGTKAAGIEGLTFHDLRGTAVTRLAIAGATEAESTAVTGHSLRDVHRILDRHYLARDPRLAESAIRKLERDGSGTDSTN